MKILLHIGQSKTGTSAIQSFLTLNRARLIEHGILYPMPYVNGLPIEIASHNSVADSLLEVSTFPHLSSSEYFRQFYQQARESNAERMILSAEHFFGGHPRRYVVPDEIENLKLYRKKIDRLAEFLYGHDIHILVYLRPQVDWLASSLNHKIKTEGLRNPKQEGYISDRVSYEAFKSSLLYSTRLDQWRAAFPATKIEVVPYVRSAFHESDVVADFWHRAGLEHIKTPDILKGRTINASLTREYIEVKKILNKSPRSKESERIIIRTLLYLSRKSAWETTYCIDDKVVRDLEDYVENDNRMITSQYLSDDQVFSARETYDPNSFRPITQKDIDDAMSQFNAIFAKPSTKMKILKESLKTFLRNKVRPLHALLHFGKQIQRQMRIKRREAARSIGKS